VLTPIQIFFKCFSSALTLLLTRTGPIFINAVYVSCSDAQIGSMDQQVAVPGSLLSTKCSLQSGSRYLSVQPRPEPNDVIMLAFITRKAAAGGEGPGADAVAARARVKTSKGKGLGFRPTYSLGGLPPAAASTSATVATKAGNGSLPQGKMVAEPPPAA